MFPGEPSRGSDASDPALAPASRSAAAGAGHKRRASTASSSASGGHQKNQAKKEVRRKRGKKGKKPGEGPPDRAPGAAGAPGPAPAQQGDGDDPDGADAADAVAGRQAKEALEQDLEARQAKWRRSGFQNALYVTVPQDPELLHDYKVVEKGTAGARQTGRLLQTWRVGGQVSNFNLAAPSSRPDITASLSRMSTSQVRPLLTGQSHAQIAEYWSSLENWMLEHLSDVPEQEVDPQDPDKMRDVPIGKYVAEIKRWEKVAKMDPETDQEAIISAMKVPVPRMPEEVVILVYEACLTPRSDFLAGRVIPGLARNRLDIDPPGSQIGFPTLLHFERAINYVHFVMGLNSPTVRVCVCVRACARVFK